MLKNKQVHALVIRVEVGRVDLIFQSNFVFDFKTVGNSALTFLLD